ncbi:MAG: hypothetical protein AB7E55_29475 [Pigmentiphaga sp.]
MPQADLTRQADGMPEKPAPDRFSLTHCRMSIRAVKPSLINKLAGDYHLKRSAGTLVFKVIALQELPIEGIIFCVSLDCRTAPRPPCCTPWCSPCGLGKIRRDSLLRLPEALSSVRASSGGGLFERLP